MAETLKEKTAKGLFWGAMNNGVQQFIGLVFGIILGRLLVPEDYGMMAMISIFSLIAANLQNSGFATALANLDHPTDEDYNSVFFFNIIMAGSLYVILFFCAPLISDYYHEPRLTPLSRFAFLGFVIASLSTVQNAWLFKNLRAKQQAKAAIVSVLVSSTMGTICAFNGLAYWSLAIQSNIYVLGIAVMAWHYSPWRPDFRHITFGPVKRMFRFSVKILATNVTNSINNNILNVLLGHYFTAHDAGNYNQAYQWNNKAWNVLQSMVNQVAQPVLVSLRSDSERQMRVLRKMIRFAAFLSFPVMLGFGLVAKEFIVTAIGQKWLVSAGYIQILCISGAFMPFYTILTNMIISKGRSGILLGGTFAFAIIQVVAMIALWPYGIETMIVAYTILNILWIFVWQSFVWKLTGYNILLFLADILPFALTAAVVMAVTGITTSPIHNLVVLLLARIVLAAVLYYAVMKVAHVKILADCEQFILSKLKKK